MLLCAVVIVFDLYSNYISPKYLRKHSVSNSTTEFSVPAAQQDLDECSSFNLAKYRMKTPLATSTPSRESFVPNQKIMSEIRRRNEKNIEDVLSPINSPENSTSNE